MDRLSELPDDILISIISRLPFQEVAATSILSTRWRHLHARVLSLNFRFAYTRNIRNLKRESKLLSDYISRINHAMDSYNGVDHNYMHVSNALRVHMPCLGDGFHDKWLEFALSRKVETIDLRVVPRNYASFCCYSIFSILIVRTCKQSLLGVKELSLSSICLDDLDIKLILTNFAFLERLSINSPGKHFITKRLMKPSVVSHAKLTHLSISNASMIASIEVRDMINLVSLSLSKLPSGYNLFLKNVPNLVHFNNDDGRHRKMQLPDILHKISCIRHQLLRLKISISPDSITKEFLFPTFENLKHMELNVVMEDRSGTHQFFPLIGACPSLEQLTIKFSWSPDAKYVHRRLSWNRVNRKKRSFTLKKVRFSGYFGSVSELELAMYLMNNAAALQEMIVEACDVTPEIRQGAIARATDHLQSVPLNSVNLVII